MILAGFWKYDEEEEETTAFACLFESDAWVELDEVVAFYDIENRTHQYYSVFLADWYVLTGLLLNVFVIVRADFLTRGVRDLLQAYVFHRLLAEC